MRSCSCLGDAFERDLVVALIIHTRHLDATRAVVVVHFVHINFEHQQLSIGEK
jgi:hypothetical protein